MANWDSLPSGGIGVLSTGIFAMGDARYYARVRTPSTWTDVEILALWDVIADYSAAKLIAVQKSIRYDPTGIPAADDKIEHRAKVLVGHVDGSATQIEIPMIEPETATDLNSLLEDLQAVAYKNVSGNSLAERIAAFNLSTERRARGR